MDDLKAEAMRLSGLFRPNARSTWSNKRSEAIDIILISRSTGARPHLSSSTWLSETVDHSVLNASC